MSNDNRQDNDSTLPDSPGGNSLVPVYSSLDDFLPQGMESLRQAHVYKKKSQEALPVKLDQCEKFFQKAARYLRPLFDEGLPGLLCEAVNHRNQKEELEKYPIYKKHVPAIPRDWFNLLCSYIFPSSPRFLDNDIIFELRTSLCYSHTASGLWGYRGVGDNLVFARRKNGCEEIFVDVGGLWTWKGYSNRLIKGYQIGEIGMDTITSMIREIAGIGRQLPGLVENFKQQRATENKSLEDLEGPSLDV